MDSSNTSTSEYNNHINVLDKGYVKLIDTFGDELTIVNAARVSFGVQKSELSKGDIGLIKYLYNHKHYSPFRHLLFRFHIKAPEVVMRQLYKHVVGIEAIQGTDQLMKETSTFFEKDSKPILIKLAKIKQNLKADLPTIGYKTVLNCKKYGIKGIAYSANKTLFLKKRKIIDFCNLNNIFLFGI